MFLAKKNDNISEFTLLNEENTYHSFDNENITYCDVNDSIHLIMKKSKPGDIISLLPGTHYTNGVFLKSNITFIIPNKAILKLRDSADINKEAFGGIANAVIMAKGSRELPLVNLKIRVYGEIDGNKKYNPYKEGGVEGINLSWVKNSVIEGDGIIHSVNGDGIDLDAVTNIIVKDITVTNNGGSGVHFGSPRPIYGSIGNVILNVKSLNNGFRAKRNGFDLSWPNPNGAVFVNCLSKDNYRNFEIEAINSVVLNSKSINTGVVIDDDYFGGANFVFINGKNQTNKSWFSRKTIIILKHKFKRFFNIDSPKYLDNLK
tara:strand:+ start:814 stop:1764 length:951 start_codon:yes stop_codon:yes gene_type:complete